MKKIEVNTPWVPPREELYKLFDNILSSKKLTNNGPLVQKLESKLAARTGVPHVYTATNGTIALHLALKALNLPAGEIITTPFSFIATSSSIIWEGYKPVFVEIEQDTLCVDANLIEERITDQTRAIMLVHVFGNACEIDKIEAISKKHDLPVIFDAAHAFGIEYKGKSIFEYGSISTLSMHATKILSSVEGGALFCQDAELAERIFQMRYFGKNRKNHEEFIGTNAKMNEFNAAFGILSLEHFDEEVARRTEIAQQYNRAFSKKDFIDLLHPRYNDNVCYAYYPVLLPSAEEVLRFLQKGRDADIIIRRYWHPSLNSIEYIGADPAETPISVASANRIVCLPIYSDMTNGDVHRVIEVFDE